MTRRTTRLLPLLLLAVLAWLAPPATAAEAPTGEFCSQETGVSVVVDYGALGEGVERGCVLDAAGSTALETFADAGYDLTPVGPFPGAVCQVDGQPEDVPCGAMPPADAYWGLYVAELDGAWDYAPVGADELEVADGDFVGFAWQSGAEVALPAADPARGDVASAEDPVAEDAAESVDGGAEAGLPVWLVYLVVVLLLASVVVVFLVRRARSST